jgi:hypothetical protein
MNASKRALLRKSGALQALVARLEEPRHERDRTAGRGIPAVDPGGRHDGTAR